MVAEAQMLLTDYGPDFGWGVTSPQLPNLVGGRATKEELERDVFDIARFGGLSADGSIEFHIQRIMACGEECSAVIRVRQDYLNEDRARVAFKVERLVSTSPELFAGAPRDPMGDLTIVATVPTDTIRSVLVANEDGYPVIVAVHDGTHLRMVSVVHDPEDTQPGETLTQFGLTVDSTVLDLVRMRLGADADEATARTLVHA